MSTVTINLDPNALREATSQAIMGVLTPEVRADILQKAIAGLLNPSTNSWEKGQSPIQAAFDRAVTSVAFELAREYVANDAAVRDRIKALLTEAATKMLTVDTENFTARMADAFVEALSKNSR